MRQPLQRVLGVQGWPSLLRATSPTDEVAAACRSAVEALQQALQACLQVGTATATATATATLVGSAAAGLHLPGCDADILVQLPNYGMQPHAASLAAVAAALCSEAGKRQGFTCVRQGQFIVQCSRKGLEIDVLVGSCHTPGPLAFLDAALTGQQRQWLSASTAVTTAAFLAQQPRLFKQSVRLVKWWAHRVHASDWQGGLRNRAKSYLLVLLTLKAYQQYMASAAAAGSNACAGCTKGGSSSSGQDWQSAALDDIFVTFLRLAAGLSSSTLLAWELQYSRDVVAQVLARPDLAPGLRPKGCEAHPLVLDPANPTNNVAAAMSASGIERLVQLAAADLAAVDRRLALPSLPPPQEQQQQQLGQLHSALRQLQQQLQSKEQQLCSMEQQLQDKEQQVVQLRQESAYQAEQQAYQATRLRELSAQLWQQRILASGDGVLCTFDVTFPLSRWLPGPKCAAAGQFGWQQLPGLWLQVHSLAYSDDDDDWPCGFEVRLAKGRTPHMDAIASLGLTIPLRLHDSSRVALTPAGDGNGGGGYGWYGGFGRRACEVRLDEMDGELSASGGLQVLLSRYLLSNLGLADGFGDCTLEALAERVDEGYEVTLHLHVSVVN